MTRYLCTQRFWWSKSAITGLDQLDDLFGASMGWFDVYVWFCGYSVCHAHCTHTLTRTSIRYPFLVPGMHCSFWLLINTFASMNLNVKGMSKGSGQGRKHMLHLCWLNCTHSKLIITVYLISPAILYFSASFFDFLILVDVGNSNIIYISSAKCVFQLSFRPALKACMIILKLCVWGPAYVQSAWFLWDCTSRVSICNYW